MKNKSSPKGKYARKLPEANKPLNTKAGEAKLKILAEAMTEQSAGGDSAHLAAGYTYFGQFVDHDLTWNRDSLAPQQLSGDRIESIPKDNFRTSFLDLDHVYGDGPGSQRSGLLYCGDVGEEQFKIGKTVASPALNLLGDTPHDFEFDGDIPL